MNEKKEATLKIRSTEKERVLTDDGVSGSLMVRGNDIPTEELISDVLSVTEDSGKESEILHVQQTKKVIKRQAVLSYLIRTAGFSLFCMSSEFYNHCQNCLSISRIYQKALEFV